MSDKEQWWYDTATGEVSQDKSSGWDTRMGPYDSREEAEAALETAKQRTKEADEYDEAEELDD